MDEIKRLLKQKNGKYCIFDNTRLFTTTLTINLTAQEYIDMCVQEAKRKAEEEIANAPNVNVFRHHIKVYNYKDIDEIDDNLKKIGEEPLLMCEKNRFKSGIESRLNWAEACEGYFK